MELAAHQAAVIGAAHACASEPPAAGFRAGHAEAAQDDERVGFAIGGAVPTGPRRSEWHHTALLVVADVVGTGVLSLPGHFGALGWLPGLLLLAGCALLNLYTGMLLVQCKLWYPRVRSLGELAAEVAGPRIAALTHGVVYGYIFLGCGNYLLVLSKSLQSIWPQLCRPHAGVAGMACLFLPNHLRTLTAIAPLSVFSNFTIVVAIAICLGAASRGVAPPAAGSSAPLVAPALAPWSAFSALSGSIFAFSGQKIYLEIMSEMRDVARFAQALCAAMASILVLYVLACVRTYAVWGLDSPAYLLDVLRGGEKKVAGMLMFLHVLISFTISQQVLNRAIHDRIAPGQPKALADPEGTRSRLLWSLLTTTTMLCAWAVANLVPFFADFVDLVGALASAPLSFLLPAALFAAAHRRRSGRVGLGRRDALLVPVCCLVTVLIMVFGTASSAGSLQAHFHDRGAPFSCLAEQPGEERAAREHPSPKRGPGGTQRRLVGLPVNFGGLACSPSGPFKQPSAWGAAHLICCASFSSATSVKHAWGKAEHLFGGKRSSPW
ncbi:unnamed protein product [Prorocentrum cordatum]|uniref:Amino acid transporter transmembrane domain-containing protein n=1 Tax=Prorocentrum cordatum TaxID=2364126 RepID=A0ABN9WKL9_9DINO|nr:unnamed protein product [Polarella glacialis]